MPSELVDSKPTEAGATSTASGVPGASAMAEYHRRSAKREATIRAKHPRLGGLIHALSEEPASTRVWKIGGIGEQRVGATLNELAGDGVLVLHDRAVPGGSPANIDHVAIGPSGVFVIDAKRYVDARIEVRRSGGLSSRRTERLFVGGRDRTNLVTGLADQIAAVYEALEGVDEFADVAVQGVLTFVDGDLPVAGSLSIAGVPVLGPRGTKRLVRRTGPLDAAARQTLWDRLALALPSHRT